MKRNTPPSAAPQLSESMGTLVSGMADDFNNILTTVMGACSLIDKDDPANSELLQCVALIRVSAERAADLTGALMRAAMPNQGCDRSGGCLQVSVSDATSKRDKKIIHDIVSINSHPDGASS